MSDACCMHGFCVMLKTDYQYFQSTVTNKETLEDESFKTGKIYFIKHFISNTLLQAF